MELTADKQHLFLHLYNGEQFENLKSQSVISRNVPYRRESFKEKHTLIQFDSDFQYGRRKFPRPTLGYQEYAEISQAIDSLEIHADSVGRAYFNDVITLLTRHRY